MHDRASTHADTRTHTHTDTSSSSRKIFSENRLAETARLRETEKERNID